VIFAIKGFKKKSIYSFAILFYFFTYFITSNLIIKIGSSFAERFLFAPSLGFCIALTFFLATILKIDFKRINFGSLWKIAIILPAILILYAFKTIYRNKEWQNNITLYASGIKTSPGSVRTHVEYASELVHSFVEKTSDMNERTTIGKIALDEYRKGLEILPQNLRPSEIYFDMGAIYYDIGDTDNAVKMYQKSLQLNSNNAKTQFNYGIILFNKHEYIAAADNFRKFVENNPDVADAFLNVANCYYALKDFKSAIQYFEKAIEQNQHNRKAILELIYCYSSTADTINVNYYKTLLKQQ